MTPCSRLLFRPICPCHLKRWLSGVWVKCILNTSAKHCKAFDNSYNSVFVSRVSRRHCMKLGTKLGASRPVQLCPLRPSGFNVGRSSNPIFRHGRDARMGVLAGCSRARVVSVKALTEGGLPPVRQATNMFSLPSFLPSLHRCATEDRSWRGRTVPQDHVC